jgi:hypothetical protein
MGKKELHIALKKYFKNFGIFNNKLKYYFSQYFNRNICNTINNIPKIVFYNLKFWNKT